MKFRLFFPFLICVCMSSCHKSKSDSNDPDTGSDNNDSVGTFVFTARGETANCSGISEDGAYQCDAGFIHDFHGVNYLTITGNDYSAPEMKENSIKIDVMLQGEVEKGTYSIVSPVVIFNCLDSSGSSCDKVGQAIVSPNGDINYDKDAMEKVLNSKSGTLTITKVSVGKYGMGFAKGKISGKFSFSGTDLSGKHPGSCSGHFENVPLTATK